jgi:hypothetical protein
LFLLLSMAPLGISFAELQSATQPLAFCACRIWFSYINPIFWTVYGLIMSQVDNLETMCALQTGEDQPVYEAVLTLFGYQ